MRSGIFPLGLRLVRFTHPLMSKRWEVNSVEVGSSHKQWRVRQETFGSDPICGRWRIRDSWLIAAELFGSTWPSDWGSNSRSCSNLI
jgi:hypothetical protein